jgi:hypothetical protein
MFARQHGVTFQNMAILRHAALRPSNPTWLASENGFFFTIQEKRGKR